MRNAGQSSAAGQWLEGTGHQLRTTLLMLVPTPKSPVLTLNCEVSGSSSGAPMSSVAAVGVMTSLPVCAQLLVYVHVVYILNHWSRGFYKILNVGSGRVFWQHHPANLYNSISRIYVRLAHTYEHGAEYDSHIATTYFEKKSQLPSSCNFFRNWGLVGNMNMPALTALRIAQLWCAAKT